MPEDKCNQCGASLDPDSIFCQQCGAKAIGPVVEEAIPTAKEMSSDAITVEEAVAARPAAEPIDPQQQAAIQAQPVEPVLQTAPSQAYTEQQTYGQQQAPQHQPYQEQQYVQPQEAAYQPQQYASQQVPQYQTYQEQQFAQQPYQTQEPQAPKKKRWWIPVIILLLAAAIAFGVWFFFFKDDSYANDTEAWHAAEEQAFSNEDSILGAWRSSANKFIESGKMGSRAEISLILNQIPDISGSPNEAAIIQSIKDIVLKLDAKIDLNLDTPQLSFSTALAKKDAEADAVSLNIYTVGENVVISIPELLDKPLVLTKEAMDQMMDDTLGPMGEADADDVFSSLEGIQENLAILSDEKIEQIFADLREIFYNYAGAPERVEDTSLTVGAITEELDMFVATIPAERFPEFLKEALVYVRDNQDIRDFISGMGSGLTDEYGDPLLVSFDEDINEMIEDIDYFPEDFQIEVKRLLYVDSNNMPRADSITLINHYEGGEEIHYESILVKDGDKGAYSLKLSLPDDNGIEYVSEFTEKGDLSTGNFEIIVTEYGYQMTEVGLSGTFSDFGFETNDDSFYPVGELNLHIKGDSISDTPIEISYNGTVARIDGVDHLLASLLIKADMYGEPLEIGFNTDISEIPEGEIAFETQLPADYIDLTDEEALSELMSDQSLLFKLMGILNNLGIDPANFME
ncbi:MAG TPA: hypothetical protein GXZ59_05790 [Clostridiaceae bacterium]|nr:hypothetical protein [Clostridiaceae bacterium]